eukprot:Nk52_evm16s284 gene=Nk52_evmTU16s284
MPSVPAQELLKLQKNAEHVRNICVLAHVDHGKTTLSDSLIASNGIISQRLAGKVRYMDSLPEEQLRGITMKSSAISLLHVLEKERYLVNLIDSPGHVDFASEVSTAVRVCDGALIVVDAVEGVCPQTHAVLHQAWIESIHPCLVLNKIDRLILELKMTPYEAYLQLQKIVEQVNVIVGSFLTADRMKEAEEESNNVENGVSRERRKSSSANTTSGSFSVGKINLEDWMLEDVDDEHVYFTPVKGNVIFASASDGWAFDLSDFAKIYHSRLGVSEEELKDGLWGDNFFNAKTKKIVSGAQAKAKKPLFVQLVLENIWQIYDSVVISPNQEKTEKIVKALSLVVNNRDLKHRDSKVKLVSICSSWLPLSRRVLSTVCKLFPSPKEISCKRFKKLIYGNKPESFFPKATHELEDHISRCDNCDSENNSTVAFVSKMVAVDASNMPENRPKPIDAEELRRRKEVVKQLRLDRELGKEGQSNAEAYSGMNESRGDESNEEEDEEEEAPLQEFIGFARVFSGTLKTGQTMYVLDSKYCPGTAAAENGLEEHFKSVKIEALYMLMGRGLELVDEVPAGNLVGIKGIGDFVFRSATLSNTLSCPSLGKLYVDAMPIVRVAVETESPADMPSLAKGLKLLNQSDPCVEILLQETGEHVILAAGEVHLERCIKDLEETFCKVKLKVSEPIVPFRETCINPQQEQQGQLVITEMKGTLLANIGMDIEKLPESATVLVSNADKSCSIEVRVFPLPESVTELLVSNVEILKSALASDRGELNVEAAHEFEEFCAQMKTDFEEAGSSLKGRFEKIWSIGPRKCGPNILFNSIENYKQVNPVSHKSPGLSSHAFSKQIDELSNSIISGFQLAALAGPLCEEPLMGVGVEILSVEFSGDSFDKDTEVRSGAVSGQLISMVKDACRYSLLLSPSRLMMAMYTCTVQVTTEFLGKLYGVISKRQGRITKEEMKDGMDAFIIEAVLPVVESFGFADEIRKKTSGLAIPQLVFTHWETFDKDPFWVPTTEDEVEHFGGKADSDNEALKYMNKVRRRKGLQILEKIVEHAEKQRTLKR